MLIENTSYVDIDHTVFDTQFIDYFSKYTSVNKQPLPVENVQKLLDDVQFIISNMSTRVYIDFGDISDNRHITYYIFSKIDELFRKHFTIHTSFTSKLFKLYVEIEGGSLCWNNNMHNEYLNLIAYPLYRSLVDILIEHYEKASCKVEDYLEDLLLEFNLKSPTVIYFKHITFNLNSSLVNPRSSL